MEDKVIVTVVEEKSGWKMDIEISSGISVRELGPVLLKCIQTKNASLFRSWEAVGILYQGYRLKPEETLEELGIWDGSILYLREGN